ncbi:ParB/RepB/Spo0J family partition protein [Streptomyces roseolilacinus]|nr:ParB N-terminal domain-containing protein [Streptomyces roseolilacinus]
MEIEHLPTQTLPLDALRTVGSPRLSGRNDEHARMLSASRDPLPPIVVHRATMRVIDGAHRVHAARLRGDTHVRARMFDGDEKDAFVLAVRANIAHGLPLTLADRTSAAARIVASHPHWSDRAIAAETGLSEHTVAAVRKRSTARPSQLHTAPEARSQTPEAGTPPPDARLGRDGRLRPTDGARRRALAGRLFAERPDATLREVARLAGISPATARDVRIRMRRGEDPVPPRRRAVRSAGGSGPVPAGPPASYEGAPDKGGPDKDASYGGAPGRGAPGKDAPDPAGGSGAIVEQLRKDPSIRLSGSGRSLLSWLGTHVVRPADCAEVVARVPPHRTGQVAQLARECARNWHRIAHRLEECAAAAE